MDPLLDEKLILTVSSSYMELAYDWLEIDVIREAYGPTDNHGLCYEYATRLTFSSSSISGDIYFCMDGYTKLLLLPYITKKFSSEPSHPELVESALLAFTKKLTQIIQSELDDFIDDLTIQSPELVSQQLVSIPSEDFRKYILIFFLKDDAKPAYLGRSYLFLAIKK